MISPSNIGVLVGGLVADPEVIESKNGKIFKFRIGADRAGSDGGKMASGYFDVVYFDNGDTTPAGSFVRRQVEEGKFHKGSQVHILYRLNQERWKTDDGNRSKVTLIAEAISYPTFNSENSGKSSAEPAMAEEVNLPAAW